MKECEGNISELMMGTSVLCQIKRDAEQDEEMPDRVSLFWYNLKNIKNG